MDKKTKNLLLLAGAGAAIYYFFLRDKTPKPTATSSFSRVVGGDTPDGNGCWVHTKMQGSNQSTELRYEEPCPYTQTSSFDDGFSSAGGSDGGCWLEVIDSTTGGMSHMYQKPCEKTIPKGISKGGGGKPRPTRKRRR